MYTGSVEGVADDAVPISLEESLRVFVQVAWENHDVTEVNCLEIADEEATMPLLATKMVAILEDLPLIRVR
jgi:hypothetical protein